MSRPREVKVDQTLAQLRRRTRGGAGRRTSRPAWPHPASRGPRPASPASPCSRRARALSSSVKATVSVNVPSASMARVAPRISGRSSWSMSVSPIRDLSRLRVVDLAADHLDEAGVVRAAVQHQRDVVAVVVLDGTVHQRRHPLGPLALLGPFGVAHRGLAGLEPDDAHELVVVGEPVGAAQPAIGRGSHLLPPRVCQRAELVLPRALALDDLDEHDDLPSRSHPG